MWLLIIIINMIVYISDTLLKLKIKKKRGII